MTSCLLVDFFFFFFLLGLHNRSNRITVDTHTAHHLWNHCFKSELMHRRTTIVVSHHIQLCGPDSKLILALDGGRVSFSGPWPKFQGSAVMNSILVSNPTQETPEIERDGERITASALAESTSQPVANVATVDGKPPAAKKDAGEARKLVKEEKRFEGRISTGVWLLYIRASGNFCFWLVLWAVLLLSSLSPVWENGWLKCVQFNFFLVIRLFILRLEFGLRPKLRQKKLVSSSVSTLE